ncbi:MAG: hypothetical protein AAGM27_09330 [Cyanobacteria bacterium J06554_3]
MADLIIPAALRLWLFFLVIFVVLDYSATFSIVFGAIAGLSGGIVSAWWQIKGGSPSEGPKGLKPVDNLKRPAADGSDSGARFELPFLKSNKAKRRYMERNKRARDRKLK